MYIILIVTFGGFFFFFLYIYIFILTIECDLCLGKLYVANLKWIPHN